MSKAWLPENTGTPPHPRSTRDRSIERRHPGALQQQEPHAPVLGIEGTLLPFERCGHRAVECCRLSREQVTTFEA